MKSLEEFLENLRDVHEKYIKEYLYECLIELFMLLSLEECQFGFLRLSKTKLYEKLLGISVKKSVSVNY